MSEVPFLQKELRLELLRFSAVTGSICTTGTPVAGRESAMLAEGSFPLTKKSAANKKSANHNDRPDYDIFNHDKIKPQLVETNFFCKKKSSSKKIQPL